MVDISKFLYDNHLKGVNVHQALDNFEYSLENSDKEALITVYGENYEKYHDYLKKVVELIDDICNKSYEIQRLVHNRHCEGDY